MRASWLGILLAVTLGACASGQPAGGNGSGGADAGGSGPTPDAGPTAGGGGPPGAEVVGGSGRMTGGTFTLEVEVGHPTGQDPAGAGTRRLEGGAVVRP